MEENVCEKSKHSKCAKCGEDFIDENNIEIYQK